ncbi:hypothetical protein L218DRAFT_990822 [Marasmius fiardii PR-910]|nr:hypothetical protein L218DRAFT_990822 [Marasmius fiardii PR-910]
MGDVSMGIAYLCSCCCCCNDNDPGPEGSRIGKAWKDPRERLVDEEFMRRSYTRDANGHIHQTQPSGSSQMVNPVVGRPSEMGPDEGGGGKSGNLNTGLGARPIRPRWSIREIVNEPLSKIPQKNPPSVLAGYHGGLSDVKEHLRENGIVRDSLSVFQKSTHTVVEYILWHASQHTVILQFTLRAGHGLVVAVANMNTYVLTTALSSSVSTHTR